MNCMIIKAVAWGTFSLIFSHAYCALPERTLPLEIGQRQSQSSKKQSRYNQLMWTLAIRNLSLGEQYELESLDQELNQLAIEIANVSEQSTEHVQPPAQTAEPDYGPSQTEEHREIEKIVIAQQDPGLDEVMPDQDWKHFSIFQAYRAGLKIQIPGTEKFLPAVLNNVLIYFLPSLQQQRLTGDSTSYCGYYALFNALQLQHGTTVLSRETRKEFLNRFAQWLLIDDEFRKKTSLHTDQLNHHLSNINSEELHKIIDIHCMTIPVPEFYMFLTSSGTFKDLATFLPEDFGPLYLFSQQAGPLSISFVASSPSQDGHWFAIRADKDVDGDVIMYVADSLHTQDWYDAHQTIARILPYAYLLLGQWDETLKYEFLKLAK